MAGGPHYCSQAAPHPARAVPCDKLLSCISLCSLPVCFQTLTNSVLAPEPKLVTLEPDGTIDYRRFLQRYVLVTSESVRLRSSIIAPVGSADTSTKLLPGTGLAARRRL